MLSVKAYNLDLELTPDQDYTGKVAIKIDLKKEGEVFVDFHGQSVKDIMVNGKAVDAKFEDHMVKMN